MKCEKCGHDDSKIDLLKSEIKELNKIINQAKTEFETSKRFIEIAKEMDTSSKQNINVYKNISKEHLARELEFLRLDVVKIRKISPDAANVLNEIIKHYEESHQMIRRISANLDDDKNKDLEIYEFLAFLICLGGVMQKVHESIEACSLAIRDTAKRLE